MSHDEVPLSHVNDCDRAPFNVAEFYARKAAWSREVFGPQQRVEGVIAHLRKELQELQRAMGDEGAIREELADICLLAIDLSWRAGGTAADFRGVENASFIAYSDAADYIGRHLDSMMPPAALAAILWDIAFRALGCDLGPIEAKLAKIKTRKIPDWRTVPADQPIEHVRENVRAPSLDETMQRCAGVLSALAPHDGGLSLEEQIATLTAERDGLRTLDEVNRLELERVRSAIHALKNETTSAAAARVWSELLTAEGRGRDVLSTLGRPITEDPVKAAQRIVAERDALRSDALLDAERLVENVSAILGVGNGSLMAVASTIAAERDAVKAERAEWRANNEALRLERDDARKILVAQPHETITMAAQRAVALCEVRKEEILRQAEQIVKLARGDGIAAPAFGYEAVAKALGMDSPRLPFAALVERAGQLRDDSVAYRSLRGRLVDMLGCPADFAENDITDLIADRTSEPFSDAEVALEEQIERLERDLRTALDALHVATGRRP